MARYCGKLEKDRGIKVDWPKFFLLGDWNWEIGPVLGRCVV